MHSAIIFLFLIVFLSATDSCGQDLTPTVSHDFWAAYSLPRNANPNSIEDHQHDRFQAFMNRKSAFEYRNFVATEVRSDLLPNLSLAAPFSLEIVLLHHVNSPIACSLYGTNGESDNIFGLGYYNQKDDNTGVLDLWSLGDTMTAEIVPHNKYWYHLILSYANGQATIYCNGDLIGTIATPSQNNMSMQLASYLEHEPFMQMENQVKSLHYFDVALNAQQVSYRYENNNRKITAGLKNQGALEFIAGPYLHHATTQSINLLWESSKPTYATVCYGESLPLGDSILVQNSNPTVNGYECYIQEVEIDNLKPATKYFYQVKLLDFNGIPLSSNIYSFKTAVVESDAFQFAAIGDTETRPHINNRISKQIWGERPDFVIHMGDLTDGGRKDHKWQWNYEYFEGMEQLHQRIPVFPVAGNGEGDLFWYKQYHRLPNREAYYTFNYGNAFFAMLNSNRRADELQEDSIQYKWLDSVLLSSSAEWKFVCMHHAPYSTDENDYGNSWEAKENYGDPNMKQLIPIFEKHGVDIVFFGHLHTYSRIGPIKSETINVANGVHYIQTGGAGGNLEDFGPTRAWFSQKVYRGHHYCMVNIMDDKLSFKMYDIEGRLRDYMEINKASKY